MLRELRCLPSLLPFLLWGGAAGAVGGRRSILAGVSTLTGRLDAAGSRRAGAGNADGAHVGLPRSFTAAPPSSVPPDGPLSSALQSTLALGTTGALNCALFPFMAMRGVLCPFTAMSAILSPLRPNCNFPLRSTSP